VLFTSVVHRGAPFLTFPVSNYSEISCGSIRGR
jgi:hypothetical protein